MMKREQKVQVTLEVAQDAEEFIRNLIREEIEAHMEKIVRRIRYGGVPRSNPVIDRMETKGEPA